MEEKSWCKEKVLNFINSYRKHECLWNTNVDFSRKKDMQRNAWKKLSVEFNLPIEVLKKKMKSLRTVYFAEKKKADRLKSNPNSDDEQHVPSLFYYSHFEFLATCRKQNNSMEEISINGITDNEDYNDDENSRLEVEIEVPDHSYQNNITADLKQDLNISPKSNGGSSPYEPPIKITRVSALPTNNVESNHLNYFPSTLPTIARVWGEKLLELEPQQRLFAEKAVNDILFEASQGNLSYLSSRISQSIHIEPRNNVTM